MVHKYLDIYPDQSVATQLDQLNLNDEKVIEELLTDIRQFIDKVEMDNLKALEERAGMEFKSKDSYEFFRLQERTHYVKLILQYLMSFLSKLPLEADIIDKLANPFEQFKSFVFYLATQLKEEDVVQAILNVHRHLNLLNDENIWYYRGRVEKNQKEILNLVQEAKTAVAADYQKLFKALKGLCLFWFSVRNESINRVRESDIYIYKLTKILLERSQYSPSMHPLIKPMNASMLKGKITKYDFHSHVFDYSEDNSKESREVGGRYWQAEYIFLGEDGSQNKVISSDTIFAHYKNVVEGLNGKMLKPIDDTRVFMIAQEGIELLWLEVRSGKPGYYGLTIVNERGYRHRPVYTAEAMKKEIVKEGRLILDGVQFIDKGDMLKLGSARILEEAVKVIEDFPTDQFEIQGHTDDRGNFDEKMELSRKQVGIIMQILSFYGIDDKKVVGKEYGPSRPLESNENEDGRLKNNRIELVKVK